MKYRVVVEVDEDGVFVAEVSALPGCVSQGASREEALTNIREAISLYIESLEDEANRFLHRLVKRSSRLVLEQTARRLWAPGCQSI